MQIEKRLGYECNPRSLSSERRCYNEIFISFSTPVLQILTKQPNTETHCKSSQHNQIQKRAQII